MKNWVNHIFIFSGKSYFQSYSRLQNFWLNSVKWFWIILILRRLDFSNFLTALPRKLSFCILTVFDAWKRTIKEGNSAMIPYRVIALASYETETTIICY